MKAVVLFLLLIPFTLATPAIDGRIVGGDEAYIVNYPYTVSLQCLNSHICGGVIISRTWILTAGSCFEGVITVDPADFQVRVGTQFRSLGGELITLAKYIRHPNYSYENNDYDIAVAQLSQPISLSRSAQIAGLPDNGNVDIAGSLANVTGWEAIIEAGVAQGALRVIEIPVMDQTLCKELFARYEVTDRMFCAGFVEGGKDACTWDWGGPLVIDSVVYGLVSWGPGCGRPDSPGVYTNVGVLRDWITEQTGL